MKIETYRGAPFVDREEEIEFFVDWFNEVPQRILWVYGPKSSGKTTVIEYVVEKKLLGEGKWREKSKFWVKYINLRETLISSYNSFLDTFFVPEDKVEKEAKIGINIIGLKAEVLERIKNKQENLFKVFIREIKKIAKKRKQPILIIDEIQKLRDLYIKNDNGDKELLKEFLNFCVRLTKETHLAHVVIITSNTVFIERIYNDARLKKTSEFKNIDHLSRAKVREWLEQEGLGEQEVLIWDYLGGCIADILRAISICRKGENLEAFLQRLAWLAYTEIVDFLTDFNEEQRVYFQEVARKIVEKGYYSIERINKEQKEFLQAWAEKEILFYDPLELKVTGNSRIYEKGMEIMLERL